MRSYILVIDPAKAAALLSTGRLNRSLKKNWVSTLAREMAEGRWRVSPQGVVLDEDGNLLDGFHRLTAVVRSGRAIEFWVTEGVPAEMFSQLDAGKPRSMADRLQIMQVPDYCQLAALARKLYAWEIGQVWQIKVLPSQNELQDIIDKNPDMVAAAKFAHGWKNNPHPSIAGFCWLLFSRIDLDEATWFFDHLRTGADLPMNSGVWALHALLNRPNEPGAFQTWQRTAFYMISAWNKQRDGKTVQRLNMPKIPLSNATFPRPR